MGAALSRDVTIPEYATRARAARLAREAEYGFETYKWQRAWLMPLQSAEWADAGYVVMDDDGEIGAQVPSLAEALEWAWHAAIATVEVPTPNGRCVKCYIDAREEDERL